MSRSAATGIEALEQRAEAANAVIDIISRHGRQFFYSPVYDRASRFDIDRHCQIWYVDHHTGMKVYPLILGADWPGFTHGRVAKELIHSLARYIATGLKVPYSLFEKDWGYGKDMATVQQAVLKTIAIKTGNMTDEQPAEEATA